MVRSAFGAAATALFLAGAAWSGPAAAQSVMQQCGQQYQAAKTANTLNGMSWNQYRTACAARLKPTPAAATGTAPAPAPAVAATPAAPAVIPPKPVVAAPVAPKPMAATPAPAPAPTPAPAPAATAAAAPAAASGEAKPMSPGRAAFVTRERQCGTEWKANKVSLVAATPGLTWPKYLSSCNARLKAAGQ